MQDQQPDPFDIDQQFAIQITLAARQLDGCLQVPPGLLQLATGHGDAAQGYVTQHYRQPVARGQPGQGVLAVQPGEPGIAAKALQAAMQRLPVGQQPGVARRLRQRQEIPQMRQVVLRLIETAAEQQRPGAKAEQPGRAVQQMDGYPVLPADEQVQVTLAEQPVQLQSFHVAGGDLRLPGRERQFDGLVQVAGHAQQTAGAQAQALHFRGSLHALQCQGHRRQQAIPAVLPVERDEEGLVLQQPLEDRATALLFPEFGAELGGHLRQMRQADQHFTLHLSQASQQLMLQVLAQQRHAGRAAPRQQDTDTRTPALGPLPEFRAGCVVQARREPVDQGVEFVAG
ncbi:hypothetical protein D3C78_628330 [compost metagenome]